jgi:hypothetical protein
VEEVFDNSKVNAHDLNHPSTFFTHALGR